MTAIFIGIVLNAINLNIGLFSYFLPALGLMLIYTRLRNYRQLSKSFVMASAFVTAMLICEVVILLMIATPLNLSDLVNICIMVVTTALLTCFLFYFMKGIQEAYQRRGDSEFKGSPVIGVAASKILLIVFLIAGFSLGAAICGLAMLIFLVGAGRRLRQAERDLDLADLSGTAVKPSAKVLWGGYMLLITLAVFSGMFLGTITSGETALKENAPAATVKKLIERGMPETVAQDLSGEDAKSLSAVTSFSEIKSKDQSHVKVRLIAGMTGDDDYKLVLWYEDLSGFKNSRCLSREIIEVSRTEPIKGCAGSIYYIKDGKEYSKKVTASKVSLNEGKILIKKLKDIDVAEVFFAEIPLRNGAEQVRGYLMLDGSFSGKDIGSSVYTELYDAKIIQFPYKNEKQTVALDKESELQRSCTFIIPYQLN